MITRSFISICLWATAAVTATALDLTPQFVTEDFDSVKKHFIHFANGPDTVSYMQPPGWSVSGGGNAISFTAPEIALASLKVEVNRFAMVEPDGGPTDFPPNSLKVRAMGKLNRGAANTELVSKEPIPLLIGGKPSSQYVFEFVDAGQRLRGSVVFCQFDVQQWVTFTTVAPKPKFDEVMGAVLNSLFGWNWKL